METGPISGEVLSVVLEPSLQVCFGYPLVSSYTAVTRACTHTCKRYCPELDLSGGVVQSQAWHSFQDLLYLRHEEEVIRVNILPVYRQNIQRMVPMS